MKILRLPRCKSRYKEICRSCNSKLLIDASDVINKQDTLELFWGTTLTFICPVCCEEYQLSRDNKDKYIQYIKVKKFIGVQNENTKN